MPQPGAEGSSSGNLSGYMASRRTAQDLAERLAAVDSGMDAATRTLFLFGAVSDESVARLVVALEIMGESRDPIRLVISSCGGDVDAGFTLYDALRVCQAPVIVDAYGVCQSIAVLILSAASLRRATPETRFMVHPGSATVSDMAPRALVDISKEILVLHERYASIIGERAGMTPAVAKAMCAKESFMSAEEALTSGLIDGIIQASNPMRLRVEKVKRRRR